MFVSLSLSLSPLSLYLSLTMLLVMISTLSHFFQWQYTPKYVDSAMVAMIPVHFYCVTMDVFPDFFCLDVPNDVVNVQVTEHVISLPGLVIHRNVCQDISAPCAHRNVHQIVGAMEVVILLQPTVSKAVLLDILGADVV